MVTSISSSKAISQDREMGCKIYTLSAISLCSPQMETCIKMASSTEKSLLVFIANFVAYFLIDLEYCDGFIMFSRVLVP